MLTYIQIADPYDAYMLIHTIGPIFCCLTYHPIHVTLTHLFANPCTVSLDPMTPIFCLRDYHTLMHILNAHIQPMLTH
jgi:hypothetical protein